MHFYSHSLNAVFLSCSLLFFGIATALPYDDYSQHNSQIQSFSVNENANDLEKQLLSTLFNALTRQQEVFDEDMVQEDDLENVNDEYPVDLQSLYNAEIAANCSIDPSISIPTVKPTTSIEQYSTCAAFVIDLTGSMTDEINSIKSVLADFLTSQLSADNDYCYILVPFIGPGQSKVYSF